jgi:hypothetical protein
MSITAVVENGSVKLPPNVPDGTRVEVTLPDPPASSIPEEGYFLKRLGEFTGMADDLPEDFALNHDHYLHGAPKKE